MSLVINILCAILGLFMWSFCVWSLCGWARRSRRSQADLCAEFREVVRVAVERELSDRKLRDWQAEAAAKDGWLAAAERAGERAAREVVRDAWRAEAHCGAVLEPVEGVLR